jgi:hypothetical protein
MNFLPTNTNTEDGIITIVYKTLTKEEEEVLLIHKEYRKRHEFLTILKKALDKPSEIMLTDEHKHELDAFFVDQFDLHYRELPLGLRLGLDKPTPSLESYYPTPKRHCWITGSQSDLLGVYGGLVDHFLDLEIAKLRAMSKIVFDPNV